MSIMVGGDIYVNVSLSFVKSKFETDKNILRGNIRSALLEAKSFEAFQGLLEERGISVRESRGRFSYLTTDRTKPITARKLGDDFSKEAVMEQISKNAEQHFMKKHRFLLLQNHLLPYQLNHIVLLPVSIGSWI